MRWVSVAVFLASAAFLGYVLFGYPLLLAVWARRRPKGIVKRLDRRTVSVLLPVRNGEPWIRRKLESLRELNYPRELVEILVISDGSTDRTEMIVEEFATQGVELLRIPPSGKAVALNRGLERARGEILFFTDVRQPLDPECLNHLVACFADPEVGVVTGELIVLEGDRQEEASVGLYWEYEKWIRRQLNRLGSLLVVTGCFYAMRRALAVPLPAGTLADDAVLPLAAFLQGYRIVFEERARAYDFPTRLEAEFRRKTRTLAGLFQLVRFYPALLGPANRMWLHFYSYKLSRLALPYACLAILVSSFGLPGGWRAWSLGAQALFYLLALADHAIPEAWPLKRISSACRTFAVWMLAALCSAAVLFLPPEKLWKTPPAGPPHGGLPGG
jgi:cellulose synthase/poly-beta-1,6-N-acetylglucosamine synthase-like glycosyltransferase